MNDETLGGYICDAIEIYRATHNAHGIDTTILDGDGCRVVQVRCRNSGVENQVEIPNGLLATANGKRIVQEVQRSYERAINGLHGKLADHYDRTKECPTSTP